MIMEGAEICYEGVYFNVGKVVSMAKEEFVKQHELFFFLHLEKSEREKMLNAVYDRCRTVFRKRRGAL